MDMVDKIAIMNRARLAKRRNRDISVKEKARDLFNEYKEQPLFLSGVTLYWAEGYKRPILKNGKIKTYHSVRLSNSDPELVKVFMLKEFDDIKPVLDSIREGYTISLVNIQPLKENDMMTLKRAIDKIKKTVEANDGDIAGIAENLLIATPSFAKVYRGEKAKKPTVEQPEVEEVETYD